MELKVFDKNEKQERPVYLKLEQNKHSGDIDLVVVDEDGVVRHGGYLIKIRSDGTMMRYAGVSPDHGFQLTDFGEIKEV